MFFDNRFTLRAENVFRTSYQCATELGHGYVGSEHILLGLLKHKEGKAYIYLNKIGVLEKTVREKLCENIGRGDFGISAVQGLTPMARKIIENAYDESIRRNAEFIGTEHLLAGILRENECYARKLLSEIGADTDKLCEILASSGTEREGDLRKNTEYKSQKEKNDARLLSNHGRNLCELAESGRLDPVIGRDLEIDKMIEVLLQRGKNNPLLLGEPGVGKTAAVEGLAIRMASGNVPKPLRGKKIFMLDMPSMVAGTKYRGEFEERIRAVLKEVKRAGNIIIFIDEIHTIVGAGSAEGAIDAANILKPAMSRREIQIIGATTYEEYRKYIEKDAALERRFRPIKIEEPRGKTAVAILQGLKRQYEEHHGIKITDEAISAAVRLSERYINDRRLPDKAIDLIDEAASRACIYASSPPPRLRELEEEIKEIGRLKSAMVSIQDFEGAARLRDKEKTMSQELERLSESWNRILCGSMEIGEESIAELVGEQTGVPLSKIVENESEKLLGLEKELSARVIGQPDAVDRIAKAVRRARCGLSDPKRPIGSFMFAGPTGVGKTELCRALAEAVFGDEKKIIKIDMSEFMEKHEVSKLIGSPPGYVGYDDGKTLAEKIRRNPYSVVLFDELEKAHPEVMNLMLQILEDGCLTDSHGRRIDFKNCIIIMTSNVGANKIDREAVGFFTESAESGYRKIKTVIAEDMKRAFSPEFINRIDEIIVFKKLGNEETRKICDKMLDESIERARKIGIELLIDEEVRESLRKKGFDSKYGARPMRRVIRREIEENLAEKYLAEGRKKGIYRASIKNNKTEIKHTES